MASNLRKTIDPEELVLIECVLSHKELFLKVISILKPSYFEAPLNYVVDFIIKYYGEYNSIPKPNIIEKETGLELQKQEVELADIPYLVDAVEEHCKEAALRSAFSDGLELMKEKKYSAIETLMKEALLVTVDRNIGINQFDDPEKRLMEMQENLDERSIGWNGVDMIIDNVRRGELVLFAANSGVGKSLILQNIARNMSLQQLHGVYISLELSEHLVSKRLDSIFSGIPIRNIFDEVESLKEFYKKSKKQYGNVYDKKLPSGANASMIRSFLNEYVIQTNSRPDYVIVDYLDEMGPNSGVYNGMNAFDRDKMITSELREVFVDFNCYGFSASQLNRSAVDVQEKHQGHIAGGMSKINISDVAMSVTKDNADPNKYILSPLKLRNSSWGADDAILYLNSSNLRLEEEKTEKKKKDRGSSNRDDIKNNLLKIKNRL